MRAMRNSAKTEPDLSAALLVSMLVDGHVAACGCNIKMFRTVQLPPVLCLFLQVGSASTGPQLLCDNMKARITKN